MEKSCNTTYYIRVAPSSRWEITPRYLSRMIVKLERERKGAIRKFASAEYDDK